MIRALPQNRVGSTGVGGKADTPIAAQSGCASIGQVNDSFGRAYGMAQHQSRARYTQMELR